MQPSADPVRTDLMLLDAPTMMFTLPKMNRMMFAKRDINTEKILTRHATFGAFTDACNQH
jgi:hypothetical protein